MVLRADQDHTSTPEHDVGSDSPKGLRVGRDGSPGKISSVSAIIKRRGRGCLDGGRKYEMSVLLTVHSPPRSFHIWNLRSREVN